MSAGLPHGSEPRLKKVHYTAMPLYMQRRIRIDEKRGGYSLAAVGDDPMRDRWQAAEVVEELTRKHEDLQGPDAHIPPAALDAALEPRPGCTGEDGEQVNVRMLMVDYADQPLRVPAEPEHWASSLIQQICQSPAPTEQ